MTDETRSLSGVRIDDRGRGRYVDIPLACPRNRERYTARIGPRLVAGVRLSLRGTRYRFQEASPMVASTGFGSQDSLFEVSFEGLAFAAHKVWPPRLKATVAFPANR